MASVRGNTRPNSRFQRKLERTAYLFIAPAAILLIIFNVIPLFASFWVSLQNMGVDLGKAKFVGFDNFVRAFHDRRLLQSVEIS